MTTDLPRLGAGVNEALRRLHIFRPTEAAIIQRELTKLRRTIANRNTDTEILPQDLVDLASHLDTTRANYPGPVPTRAYAEAVALAGWTPPKGT